MIPKEAVGKWAIITLHPTLPSRAEQIARARAWAEDPALIEDDVRHVPRTTKWDDKFPERAEFLGRMKGAADVRPQIAFFATPLCLGFGRAHAAKTVQDFWALGIHIYVHSPGAVYAPGDDVSDLLARVATEANAGYQRKYDRKKAVEKKRKSKKQS